MFSDLGAAYGGMWTSVYNNLGVSCNDPASCQGSLTDSGLTSPIDLSGLDYVTADASSPCETVRLYSGKLRLDHADCTSLRAFICQSSCDREQQQLMKWVNGAVHQYPFSVCPLPPMPPNMQPLSTRVPEGDQMATECTPDLVLDTDYLSTVFDFACLSDSSLIPWPNCVNSE